MKAILVGMGVTGALVAAVLASGMATLEHGAPVAPPAALLDAAPQPQPRAIRTRPATPPAAPAATGGLVVPVQGVAPAALVDTWGQSRENGARVHQAIDIAAAIGTPVVAAADGRVEKLFTSARGGLTVYVRLNDPAWQHYYAHLASYAPGLAEGQAVRAGQVIGTVGETGNVAPGSPHLHFAVNRMAPGERWSAGKAVNPYPLLVGDGRSR